MRWVDIVDYVQCLGSNFSSTQKQNKHGHHPEQRNIATIDHVQ
jgi:hypothetical protein